MSEHHTDPREEEARRQPEAGRLGGAAGTAARPAAAPVAAGNIVSTGAAAGLIAGAVFLFMEILVTAAMGMSWAMPLRMMASIFAGQAAMGAEYALGTAILVGLIAHALISMFWGVVFAALASQLRLAEVGVMALAGAVFGFAVWIIDFFIITLFAWPWFREANQVVQFVAHTFFFGLPLGYALWAMWRRPLR